MIEIELTPKVAAWLRECLRAGYYPLTRAQQTVEWFAGAELYPRVAVVI